MARFSRSAATEHSCPSTSSLTGRIRRARYIANISKPRWAEALDEHEQILTALEARDGDALGLILKDHLRKTCETVKQALREDDAAGSAAAE